MSRRSGFRGRGRARGRGQPGGRGRAGDGGGGGRAGRDRRGGLPTRGSAMFGGFNHVEARGRLAGGCWPRVHCGYRPASGSAALQDGSGGGAGRAIAAAAAAAVRRPCPCPCPDGPGRELDGQPARRRVSRCWRCFGILLGEFVSLRRWSCWLAKRPRAVERSGRCRHGGDTAFIYLYRGLFSLRRLQLMRKRSQLI